MKHFLPNRSAGNTKGLFGTIDHLLKGPFPPIAFIKKCEEFADFFENKIASIGTGITGELRSDHFHCHTGTMHCFKAVTLNELYKIVSACNSLT